MLWFKQMPLTCFVKFSCDILTGRFPFFIDRHDFVTLDESYPFFDTAIILYIHTSFIETCSLTYNLKDLTDCIHAIIK